MDSSSFWERIEQYFAAKRGSALILSPKDWPLVSSWEERGIPIETIFEGIDAAYQRYQERCAAGHRQANWTLTSCQHDVERAWKTWCEQHPEADVPDEQDALKNEQRKLKSKVQSTIARLQTYAADGHYACARDAILDTVNALGSINHALEHANDDAAIANIKTAIRQTEQTLATRLEYAIPESIRQHMQAKAEARLASHKSQMSDAIYQETLQLAFFQELHRLYPLPSFL